LVVEKIDHFRVEKIDHFRVEKIDHFWVEKIDHFWVEKINHFRVEKIDHFWVEKIDHFLVEKIDLGLPGTNLVEHRFRPPRRASVGPSYFCDKWMRQKNGVVCFQRSASTGLGYALKAAAGGRCKACRAQFGDISQRQ
jgi:hypothetical protein